MQSNTYIRITPHTCCHTCFSCLESRYGAVPCVSMISTLCKSQPARQKLRTVVVEWFWKQASILYLPRGQRSVDLPSNHNKLQSLGIILIYPDVSFTACRQATNRKQNTLEYQRSNIALVLRRLMKCFSVFIFEDSNQRDESLKSEGFSCYMTSTSVFYKKRYLQNFFHLMENTFNCVAQRCFLDSLLFSPLSSSDKDKDTLKPFLLYEHWEPKWV